ncbi:RNA-directed DNA polymerase, eukaryota [Tanacetum coccineum]
MDEQTIRLWLKEHQDAAERLAAQQTAAFQAQFEALRTELQAATGLLHNTTFDQVLESAAFFGTVVDVFIPFKKSQAGKRFAFVRFIKVFSLDRLVKNLCTIWIGRHHLYANQVRFERPNKPVSPTNNGMNKDSTKRQSFTGHKRGNNSGGSYAHVVNGGSSVANPASLISPSPALVLDETCVIERDFSKCVMGKVKDANSISNIQTFLHDEGFVDVKPKYLGGLWVMLEFEKEESKSNLLSHTGANSWFQTLQEVAQDFVSEERIAWIDIEGVPLHAWSFETFFRIGKKWGEMLNIEDTSVASFGRKRVCILTKIPVSILESFKIIVKGKVFMIRAKELFTWSPTFSVNKESICTSDDESVQSEMHILKQSYLSEEEEGEFKSNDVEGVAEIIFGENSASAKCFMGHEAKSDKAHDFGEAIEVSGIDPSPQIDAEVLNAPQMVRMEVPNGSVGQSVESKGGSVLGVLEEVIRVGQAMGFSMEGCEKDIQDIIGKQGDDLPAHKRDLWEYMSTLLGRWSGEVIIMGDFNEVRFKEERRGSGFNQSGARVFNQFITSSGLVDVKLEGFSFTWSHPSATKMSKLDRFLVSDGIISLFPSITALCLDRHLSDHRPILLRDIQLDFGPTLFWFYHSWFSYDGFDEMVEQNWRSFSHSDTNGMIRFKKKLQELKSIIRIWIKDKRATLSNLKHAIEIELRDIDKELDSGYVSDTYLARRLELKGQLHEIKDKEAADFIQKSKVRWVIEGDENSRFFHGIINKKRSQLAIRGILVDGSWQTEPLFEARFKKPIFKKPNQLSHNQVLDLEREVSRDEIRSAVWNCRDNKSPGPDGYTFEFFKKYWGFIGIDFCEAVEHFFNNGAFAKGCNSSFIALIPKIMDAKLVTDFHPISLIGCVYKVVTKIFAKRLAMVISNIVSNTQSAFVSERQILDGPFIINEVLHWCKRKNKKAMFFKVDFVKAYDSVRWDYLIDVLEAFVFGMTWCQWIRGLCYCAKASVLVNGSPSREFQFQCGLKQGDSLAPLLFILMMESLHLSFSRVVEAGIFKGIRLNNSISLSHLFYADDALIVGEWSSDNLRGIINVLKCFFLASGLQINIHKSQLLGVGVSRLDIEAAAASIGCSIMDNQFRYLGVMVGGNTSRHKFWADVVSKLRSRLSKWKTKTLSIGGRLTLLKSVLGASPLYCMSIFKAPKGVLKEMESIRNNFFIGADTADKKITWVAWDKVLASKKNGGLGVSSYFALNRALLLKWIWRFVSQDDSLWFQVMQAIYGPNIDSHSVHLASNWCSILREMQTLKDKGFDFLSLCSKRVGDGNNSRFWLDIWKGDITLRDKFPRIFALEMDKTITVAAKMASLVDSSFRRPVRGGIEHVQFNELRSYIDSVTLSNSHDRWICNMSGDGIFRVKDIRNSIDDLMLPSWLEPTKWVKYVPIKINIFGWRARRDCLPTTANLIRRGVYMEFSNCQICGLYVEDTHHVLFQCDLAQSVLRRICRWWDLDWQTWSSFSTWDAWFSSIRLALNNKKLLEGVFYVAWWSIWVFQNRLLFDDKAPARSMIVDDIMSLSFLWCKNRCKCALSWEA